MSQPTKEDRRGAIIARATNAQRKETGKKLHVQVKSVYNIGDIIVVEPRRRIESENPTDKLQFSEPVYGMIVGCGMMNLGSIRYRWKRERVQVYLIVRGEMRSTSGDIFDHNKTFVPTGEETIMSEGDLTGISGF